MASSVQTVFMLPCCRNVELSVRLLEHRVTAAYAGDETLLHCCVLDTNGGEWSGLRPGEMSLTPVCTLRRNDKSVVLPGNRTHCLGRHTHSLTFWHRNYFFNFSTPVYKM